MSKFKIILIAFVFTSILTGLFLFKDKKSVSDVVEHITDFPNLNMEDEGGLNEELHPLSIERLREGGYPGSKITIEQTLDPGSNYQRYITSYKSDGLKIYALLTIPNGDMPSGGFPSIIFNHGYIPPAQYRTTERYLAYTDGFARNGYLVFKPDFRGHGNSEGEPSGAYGSSAYSIDVLNAVSSVKKLTDPSSKETTKLLVNPEKIGMWGHSMGGHITLRNMVISKDVKAGVIWAGVVGSYSDLLENWRRSSSTPPPGIPTGRRRWRDELIAEYGSPQDNPEFWNSISANSYLTDLSGPIQLHHGTADSSVPVLFSQTLENQIKNVGKEVELFVYQGDDHNLSVNFSLAMNRSVQFFDDILKE